MGEKKGCADRSIILRFRQVRQAGKQGVSLTTGPDRIKIFIHFHQLYVTAPASILIRLVYNEHRALPRENIRVLNLTIRILWLNNRRGQLGSVFGVVGMGQPD